MFRRRPAVKGEDRRLGAFGEKAACRYLKKQGYRILERNYTAHGYEIDIIARKDNTVAFCEVKTRTLDAATIERYGLPRRAVNREKQRHIRTAAQYYRQKHPQNPLRPAVGYRFDILEVYLDKAALPRRVISKIEHLERSFI